jgi:hypothetical protein
MHLDLKLVIAIRHVVGSADVCLHLAISGLKRRLGNVSIGSKTMADLNDLAQRFDTAVTSGVYADLTAHGSGVKGGMW